MIKKKIKEPKPIELSDLIEETKSPYRKRRNFLYYFTRHALVYLILIVALIFMTAWVVEYFSK